MIPDSCLSNEGAVGGGYRFFLYQKPSIPDGNISFGRLVMRMTRLGEHVVGLGLGLARGDPGTQLNGVEPRGRGRGLLGRAAPPRALAFALLGVGDADHRLRRLKEFGLGEIEGVLAPSP